MQKQGVQVVDLVQKTFRECTIADAEPYSQGSRARLSYDLLLAAFSKQIHCETRIHTRGLSPGFLQGLSLRLLTKGLAKSSDARYTKPTRPAAPMLVSSSGSCRPSEPVR